MDENSTELTLYTTVGCHLCEQAEMMLDEISAEFLMVDIAEDLGLLERYGVRIPVITKGRLELCWPFDSKALCEFLK